MEIKELNDALDTLKKELEGKSNIEIKSAFEAFETKHKDVLETKLNEALDAKTKTLKDEFEIEIKALKDYASKLDVKLQKKVSGNANAPEDGLKTMIQDNFDEIKLVRKGNKVNIETKAVGNMTLGNHLTGDQYRDYSYDVAMVPRQLLNFADLVQAITISGGTYTFPRETGSEGSISTQTEGSDKSQIDYDLTMVDANTDFIAGFAVYSKKMANNLPFLESFLPQALRRDYWKAENGVFNTALAAAATASSQAITGQNKIEMLIAEIATLEGTNFAPNGIVLRPADYWDIMVTEKSTGAGYGLPGVVTMSNGQLRINGIPLFKANWIAANKYYVGDWSTIKKVITEGLSVEFSQHDEDNFRKNNVTARVESQVTIAVERPDAVIYGDFTAT